MCPQKTPQGHLQKKCREKLSTRPRPQRPQSNADASLQRPRHLVARNTSHSSAICDVRFGSLADICSAEKHVRFASNSDRERRIPAKSHVCFASESGRVRCKPSCPLWANSELMHRNKTVYSKTSSARPSSGSGIVRWSALAVLRLMINSTFVRFGQKADTPMTSCRECWILRRYGGS